MLFLVVINQDPPVNIVSIIVTHYCNTSSVFLWNSAKIIFKIDDPATSVSILILKLKTYLNKQLLGDVKN